MPCRQLHRTAAAQHAAEAADAIRTALMQPTAPTRGVVFGSPAANLLLASQPPALAPCPFCGKHDNLTLKTSTKEFTTGAGDNERSMATHTAYIACTNCGAHGPKGEITQAAWHFVNFWQLATPKWQERNHYRR